MDDPIYVDVPLELDDWDMTVSNERRLLSDYKAGEVLFCYLDESGDFNFTETGSKYFIFSAMVTTNPLQLMDDLQRLKYRILLSGRKISKSHQTNCHFHATEDSPETQRDVFSLLSGRIMDFNSYSVIAQKNKTNPSIREPRVFYGKLLKRLVDELVPAELSRGSLRHICILLDTIPVKSKRESIVSPVKSRLKALLHGSGISWTLEQMESKTDFCMQAADYCTWAVHRKWTNGDTRFYDRIGPSVLREVDYFYYGDTTYY